MSIPVFQARILSGANCLHFFVSTSLSQNTGLGRVPQDLPVLVAECYLGRYMCNLLEIRWF